MDKYMILCLELLVTNLILLLTIINVYKQSKRITKVSEKDDDYFNILDKAIDNVSFRLVNLENAKKDVKKTNKKESK